MNEVDNKGTNAVEDTVNTCVTDNHTSGQEAAPPEQGRQKCSQIGDEDGSSVPAVEESVEKSEPKETQPAPEADASKHEESAGDKPAEPSGDLNNDADPSPTSEPAPEPIVDTTLDILARQKEDNITRLNAELDKFKADMRFDIKKSLISDVIDEVNLMSKEYRSLKAKSTESIDPAQILEDFRLFAEEDFLECLERHQVYAIRTEVGKPFDNLRHIKRGKVPTDNPELDGKVCESISDGFEARLQMNPASAEPVVRVLQREKVSVYSFTPSDTPATPPETTVEK